MQTFWRVVVLGMIVVMSGCAAVPRPFSCVKKTCSQVASCAEAFYLLETCGYAELDGDHDGQPCEQPAYPQGCPHRE